MKKTYEEQLVEDIKYLFTLLPHSESRVPYTYHHDYLRMKVYSGYSRSDIADLKNWSEVELYSTALVELLNELGVEEWASYCTGSTREFTTVVRAVDIVGHYIKRINSKTNCIAINILKE